MKSVVAEFIIHQSVDATQFIEITQKSTRVYFSRLGTRPRLISSAVATKLLVSSSISGASCEDWVEDEEMMEQRSTRLLQGLLFKKQTITTVILSQPNPPTWQSGAKHLQNKGPLVSNWSSLQKIFDSKFSMARISIGA